MNRQRLILCILLLLLVVAVVSSYFRMPRQKTVSVLKYAPGKQAAPAAETGASKAAPVAAGRNGQIALRMDLLEREIPVFKGYRRNPFKPVFVDEIMVAKQKAAAFKPVTPPPPPPPPLTLPIQPAPPQRELARFTFLGFLKKDNRQTIFLAKDRDIFLVKKGDTFGGRFQASSITDQALTILVADTGEEIVIPLIESRSLVATQ